MTITHEAESLEASALQWLASGGAAYLVHAPSPVPWLDRLTQLFFRSVHQPIPPTFPAGVWSLGIEGDTLSVQSIPTPPIDSRIVLLPLRECEASIRLLVQLARRGVRQVWFFESADGWKVWNLHGLLAWRAMRRFAGSRWLPFFRWLGCGRKDVQFAFARACMTLTGNTGDPSTWHPVGQIETDWNSLRAGFALPHECRSETPQDIVHYTGALFSGGAERQLCNLAVGQSRRGMRVRVYTAYPPTGERAHYAPVLLNERIPLSSPEDTNALGAALLPWSLQRLLPLDLARQVSALAGTLKADPTHLLHCWLDEPNVIGALAGLLAGVPNIVLSTRNSNPTNFPRLLTSYLLPLYRLVAQHPSVHFIANSHSGAASYAEWIGIPVSRFHVVFNGVRLDHFPTPTPEARGQARKSLGLGLSVPVVCGVFRLAAEKQPWVFLDVIRHVRTRVPDLQVLLLGDGDLAEDVAREVRSTGLADCVHLLGRRSDVETIYLASDVTLLTSLLEGCPNVALESQHLSVPVVATAGGGTTDAVLHGTTGYLAAVGDTQSLAAHLTRLLTDSSLRARMAATGPNFVASRFGLEQMVDQTQDVYRVAAQGRHDGRVLPPQVPLLAA